ncbi:MAG: hypothetical protein LBB91_01045 [Clostridiales bacterium]|jgi:cyclic beta-1,2-glucan synthetase|nr:hypothetical protein [Clostridiales bacterium]
MLLFSLFGLALLLGLVSLRPLRSKNKRPIQWVLDQTLTDEQAPSGALPNQLDSRLEQNFAALKKLYRRIAALAAEGEAILPAAVWLLDNFYLLEEEYKALKKDLQEGAFADLPLLASGQKKGLPRDYALGQAIVGLAQGRLSEQGVREYLDHYQPEAELGMEELWLLPAMVKMALIEYLAGSCRVVSEIQECWLEADKIDFHDSAWLDKLKSRLDNQQIARPAFVNRLIQRMRNAELPATDLGDILMNVSEQLLQDEKGQEAGQELVFSGVFGALKDSSSWDWQDIFEQYSPTEAILRQDPVYAAMDEESREKYRHLLENISIMHQVGESFAAAALIQLAQNQETPQEISGRAGHIGYYLLEEEGQKTLARLLKGRPPDSGKLLPVLYILLQAVFALAFGLAAGFYAPLLWAKILMGLAFCLLGWEIGNQVVNRLAASLVIPTFLPRLEYKESLPPEASTAVVVTALLSNAKRGAEMAGQLEVHYLASGGENISFVLLADLPEAKTERAPLDAAIIQAAQEKIDRLNQKYGPYFYLLWRQRKLTKEGVWSSWERKRGALLELNNLLRGEQGSFAEDLAGDCPLRRVQYVLTLDADTRLPVQTVQKLTGIINHPLNRPLIENGRVKKGYGLIQPHIAIEAGVIKQTPFAALFAAGGGIDTYSSAFSNPYQDIFHQAIFTGKGIYHLDTYRYFLNDLIPDNTILSHDLLEGNILRTALASHVQLVDGYPAAYLPWILRLHRWIRGDWQLLPWLKGKIRSRYGPKTSNPLNFLARWQIIDNLRRSLLLPATALAFLAGVLLPGQNLFWLPAVMTAVFFNPLLNLPAWLKSKSGGKTFARRISSPAALWGQAVFNLLVLPHYALMIMDAIARTLFRLTLSRRNLLQWIPAAEIERGSKNTLPAIWRRMAPPLFIALIIAAIGVWLGNTITAIILAVLFGASPFLAYSLSRPYPALPRLKQEEEEDLRQIAKEMWQFYEDYAGESDNWLPPDNVQISPPKEAAHRVSPTNIAFLLLSAACARQLGFIDTPALLSRIKKVFATLERMEKWQGHLYNWYNSRDLEVMRPAFVSTVDSGNLAVGLLALAQALRILDDGGSEAAALALEAENIAYAMDFRPLYNKKKQLFSVGWHRDKDACDKSFYDLLASEARLTIFFAVARRHADPDAWFRAGRMLRMLDGYKGLCSWSGTMFEYLMPDLLLIPPPGTLLAESSNFALYAQRKHNLEKGLPWGISESGFYRFDLQLNYQYRAFGVPELGLERAASRAQVIAPYAGCLALPLAPRLAWDNLQHLRREGLSGKYGLYEAIDYGEGGGVVKSFMAHHQGMSIVAIANYLTGEKSLPRLLAKHPLIKSAELLLQEKMPDSAIILEQSQAQSGKAPMGQSAPYRPVRQFGFDQSSPPSWHLLADGGWQIVLDSDGNGYSGYNGTTINRPPHQAGEQKGIAIACRKQDGSILPATPSPFGPPKGAFRVEFALDRAVYHHSAFDLESHLQIIALPEDSGELRRLKIKNRSLSKELLEICAWFEPILTSIAADRAHPAFSNLFIEVGESEDAVIAWRRPRNYQENPFYIAFGSALRQTETCEPVEKESKRANFFSREEQGYPKAFAGALPFSGITLHPLDPLLALRQRLVLEPGAQVTMDFYLLSAGSFEEAAALAAKYHENSSCERAFELALVKSKVAAGYLPLKQQEAQAALNLGDYLLGGARTARDKSGNRLGRHLLWGEGISGDLPLVLFNLAQETDSPVLTSLFRLHEYWYNKGRPFDFLILCQEEAGYFQPLLTMARNLLAANATSSRTEQKGGIYLRQAAAFSPAQKKLFSLVAAAVFHGRYPLERQLLTPPSEPLPPFASFILAPNRGETNSQFPIPNSQLSSSFPTNSDSSSPPAKEKPDYELRITNYELPSNPGLLSNGLGSFSSDGREYRINLEGGKSTPAPWSNILANPDFGCLVTESGLGYTWWKNSRENKISPWYNDTLLDSSGEAIDIRDEDTGEVFSPTPRPLGQKGNYQVSHAWGSSSWLRQSHGIRQELTVFVDKEAPVKTCLLQLENIGNSPRRLSAWFYLRPLLAAGKDSPLLHIQFEPDQGLLLIDNPYENQQQTIFLASSLPPYSYSGDSEEFLGRWGSLAAPEALKRVHLSNQLKAVIPGAILQVKLDLAPGGSQDLTFSLGAASSKEEALILAGRFRQVMQSKRSLQAARDHWQQLLGTIQVETVDPALNTMLNGWLTYQTLACRIYARSAFYQCGGAFGFRDQLQDILAFLPTQPHLARAQIILAAHHQFPEGDVLHWWHQGQEIRGVRTRFSDDLLWLPFVVAAYIENSGETAILDEEIPWLKGEPLAPGVMEFYSEYQQSNQTADLYRHCLAAVEQAMKWGGHGLPLIGCGDWNDGMSALGIKGKGESVWLAWFLLTVINNFSPILSLKGDDLILDRWSKAARQLKINVEEHGWDGAWYRRAYDDEGEALGSALAAECRIDSLTQSWAVLSGAARPERARQAMDSALQQLLQKEAGILLLLSPPFTPEGRKAGYINSYPPGVRENGGQYTHAAAWMVAALCQLGQGDSAFDLWQMVNPINHSRTELELAHYRLEPYVAAADIYSGSYSGQGGWSWYTGAAAWLYIVALRELLGFKKQGGQVQINPVLPGSWPGYKLEYRYKASLYSIEVRCRCQEAGLWLDGEKQTGNIFHLSEDGQKHQVLVQLS